MFLKRNCFFSFQEYSPLIKDINLAIERMFCYEHIVNNPVILNSHVITKQFSVIPSLNVPQYVVDIGLVIMDTLAHYTILLENYGSWKIKSFVSFHKKLLKGLKVIYGKGPILPHATKEMFLLFSPSRKDYPKPISVSTLIFLNVSVLLSVRSFPNNTKTDNWITQKCILFFNTAMSQTE